MLNGINDPHSACVIVLVKDFSGAKTRLATALDPDQRRSLAIHNARLAFRAARIGTLALAVCGSESAAHEALTSGLFPLLEREPKGQNQAAELGLEYALGQGAKCALVLSSDLPLITSDDVVEMIRAGQLLGPKATLVAPAIGRGGTNALYLAPPDVIGLHFGANSLPKFEAEAAALGIRFGRFESPRLALDLDEPSDLQLLAELTGR